MRNEIAVESHGDFVPTRDEDGAFAGSRFVIFDGACGFCTACVRVAMRLDRNRRFAYVPLQWCSPADFARFHTSEAACRRALHVVEGRTTTRGAFAVNHFLWSIDAGRFAIVLVWCVWPLLAAEIIGYEVVAANRRWISRVFRTQRCALIHDEPLER